LAQLAASKIGPLPSPAGPTNWFSAAFGSGGPTTAAALVASTMPTPREPRVAAGVSFADTISAPLTWSGVHSGWRARTCAAAAATTGAANDVPESSIVLYGLTLAGRSIMSVALLGTAATMYRPGAASSGFANPSSV
jgi:hypothetical protein